MVKPWKDDWTPEQWFNNARANLIDGLVKALTNPDYARTPELASDLTLSIMDFVRCINRKDAEPAEMPAREPIWQPDRAKPSGLNCRGSHMLGTACGKCASCQKERERMIYALREAGYKVEL